MIFLRTNSKGIFFIVCALLCLRLIGKETELVCLGASVYGQWTVPIDLFDSNSICYCAGAGEDISFDVALVTKFGANVYIFDPTPRAIKHFDQLVQNTKQNKPFNVNNDKRHIYDIKKGDLDKLHFMAAGLWNKDTIVKFYEPKNPQHVSHSILNLQHTNNFFEGPCYKLSTLMSMLGHEKIDLLKIDIEGAEYAVLDTIFEEHLYEKISCICLEFDEVAFNNAPKEIQNIEKKANYYLSQLVSKGFEIVYQRGLINITLVKKDT